MAKINEFANCYNTHRLNISASNIFLNTIKMLNGRNIIIDRKIYEEHFLNRLSDIELVTPPTDAFVPVDEERENDNRIMIVNQLTPEFIEISKRITLGVLEKEIFNEEHEIVKKIKENIDLLETVHEDLCSYYNMYKYLDQIDIIRISSYSNYTPVIEYIVENITLKDWKNYLVSKKTNEEKYEEKCADILFNPDVAAIQKFYSVEHTGIEISAFDVVNLMMRLVSNMVLKSDIYLVLGMFMTLSFAMGDIRKGNIENSRCALYVRNVISKL